MDRGPKVTGSNVPLWLFLAMFAAKRKLKAEAVSRSAEDRAVRPRRRRFKLIDSVGKSSKSMSRGSY